MGPDHAQPRGGGHPVGAVLGGLFIYSATREEAYLTEQFPDTYRAYKRSTKMLIPFVL